MRPIATATPLLLSTARPNETRNIGTVERIEIGSYRIVAVFYRAILPALPLLIVVEKEKKK
jgi:hypothetical protein